MHKSIPPHSIKEEDYESDDINDNKQYTIVSNDNDNMQYDLAQGRIQTLLKGGA